MAMMSAKSSTSAAPSRLGFNAVLAASAYESRVTLAGKSGKGVSVLFGVRILSARGLAD
jgi:hypothetical protein